MLKGNKGEWSEIYVFLKLLGEGKLDIADENLKPFQGIYYDIIKIIREEIAGKKMDYLCGTDIVIADVRSSKEISRIPSAEFLRRSKSLYSAIVSNSSPSFSDAATEQFLNSINVNKLKETSKQKRDITIKVHDHQTSMDPILGFSIKSNLGALPTLLNPSEATNFIFFVKGASLSINNIKGVNSIESKNKLLERIKSILDLGGELEFECVEGKIFENNLRLIDGDLDRILAWILFYRYSMNVNDSIENFVSILNANNPLRYNLDSNHPFYEYKLARFLEDIAFGMTPSSIWTGTYNATGGYIIVKENGDIVCYHIYNRNAFKKYLLKNVRLDTPSTTRYKFGSLYQEQNKTKIKLNLQLRFV